MNIWDALLSLFFPQECKCCGRYIKDFKYEYICHDCHLQIKPTGTDVCKVCGIPYAAGNAVCPECTSKKRSFSYLRSAGIYDGGLKSLIHSLKFEGKTRSARVLGDYMLAHTDFDFSGAVIVPVPISDKTKKERGYNQSMLLAKHISDLTGAKITDVLLKTRETLPQRDLDKEERERNIKGAFAAKGKVSGTVVLLDDVSTTCATLNEAAKVLLEAGADEVICITAARAI